MYIDLPYMAHVQRSEAQGFKPLTRMQYRTLADKIEADKRGW